MYTLEVKVWTEVYVWEEEESIPGRLPALSPLRRRDSADVVVDREAEVGCDERDWESPFVIRECRASVCLAAPLPGPFLVFRVSAHSHNDPWPKTPQFLSHQPLSFQSPLSSRVLSRHFPPSHDDATRIHSSHAFRSGCESSHKIYTNIMLILASQLLPFSLWTCPQLWPGLVPLNSLLAQTANFAPNKSPISNGHYNSPC
jgi:hypothetical protein